MSAGLQALQFPVLGPSRVPSRRPMDPGGLSAGLRWVQNSGRDSAAETSQCWRPREKGAGIWCGAMLGRQSWKEEHWMKLMLILQEDLLWSV
ncbi:unnamed protein product [Gadus morhua 'NCC']